MRNIAYSAAAVLYSVSGKRDQTFDALDLSTGDHTCKPSAGDQPTRPTQPFILSGSII